MTLTLSNMATMSALNQLTSVSNQLDMSSLRLVTGHRINRASDDPAGLIAATNMDSQLAQLEGRIRSAERVGSIVDTMDGSLEQMSSILTDMKEAMTAAAGGGLTQEELDGYQSEIDMGISSLSGLVQGTTFNGEPLLDGSLAYETSGVDSGDIDNLRISSVSSDAESVEITVDVTVGADTTVEVNGEEVELDGSVVSFSVDGVTGQLDLSSAFLSGSGSTSFTVDSTGAGWQVDGSATGDINYGLGSMDVDSLGSLADGFLTSLQSGGANDIDSGNFETAASVLDAAISHVATERGRLGCVKKYSVDAYTNSLEDAKTAMLSAKSQIMDIDYGEETALNSQLQNQVSVATAVIGMMSQNRGNMISLLLGGNDSSW